MKSTSEIKKGCGRMFVKNGFEMFCCKTDFVEHLCPTCQALLEQAIEFEKELREASNMLNRREEYINELKDRLEKQSQQFQKMIEGLYFKKCKEQGLHIEEWTEGEMFSLNELQELLKEVKGEKL
jgi:hypothetical protein